MNDQKDNTDWKKIYKQLADSRRALNDTFALDEAGVQQRLRRRAEQLARRRTGTQRAQSPRRVFVFLLGQQRFAFDLERVTKVTRLDHYVRIQGGPQCLLGVGNFDGEIYSVLDLRQLLSLPEGDSDGAKYVLLLQRKGCTVGFQVDHVEEVRSLDANELVTNTEALDTISQHVGAITRDNIIVLDAEALLAQGMDQESI